MCRGNWFRRNVCPSQRFLMIPTKGINPQKVRVRHFVQTMEIHAPDGPEAPRWRNRKSGISQNLKNTVEYWWFWWFPEFHKIIDFRYVSLDSRRIGKRKTFQKLRTVNPEGKFAVFARNGECGGVCKTSRQHENIKKSVARAHIPMGSVFGKLRQHVCDQSGRQIHMVCAKRSVCKLFWKSIFFGIIKKSVARAWFTEVQLSGNHLHSRSFHQT